MLRKNCHRHIIKKCHIRRIQLKCDRVVINHVDFFHILIIRCILRAIVRIHDRLDRKFYVIRSKILTIVPLHALFKMEGIGACFLIKLPAFCQTRNDLILSVMCCQAIEQQNIDFSVLIHCRIDSRVITASVYQRGSRCCTDIKSKRSRKCCKK